jgi:DNA-directed RNA polymerase omega subunit
MGFVPTEKLTNVIDNKYEAILVAAKEARVRNSIAQLSDWDPEIERPKITSVALDRLGAGLVDYHYSEPETEDAEGAETEDE